MKANRQNYGMDADMKARIAFNASRAIGLGQGCLKIGEYRRLRAEQINCEESLKLVVVLARRVPGRPQSVKCS